eukprot:4573616-Amphidinium_carterae.1
MRKEQAGMNWLRSDKRKGARETPETPEFRTTSQKVYKNGSGARIDHEISTKVEVHHLANGDLLIDHFLVLLALLRPKV